jgi:hypothetical protein
LFAERGGADVFSSLDRVDIVLGPGPDGRPQYVQTDHRTAEEIEREPELSALFALVRVLNPKRMAEAGSPEPVVIYAAQERLPAFLRRAIHAAGGRLVIGDILQPEADEDEPAALEKVVESVFTNLARAVAAEHETSLTLDGLQEVERALAEVAGDPEEDEVAYWSAVVKLGCFGGEVIRSSNGGRWKVTDSGSLPFALSTRFRGAEATVNPFGKAIKRFASGEEDSLVALANLVRSQP